MGYYFYYPLENKIFVARYAEFFETNLIKREASGSTIDFDEIQSEDAQPSENTSLHQHEVKPDTVEPQTDVIPVRRSARISQAPERYGFYIDAEEHELGDHGEPLTIELHYRILNFQKSSLKAMNTENAIHEKTTIDGYFQTWNYPNVDLSNTQGPSTPAKVKRMKGIPYASVRFHHVRCEELAVKNILKYLRNTKDMFLLYGGDSTTELGVICYTDASWETDRDDLRSQIGFVFVMNGGAVDWKSF
ncbi:hypothetical protein Tco_0584551 [Tanacetum coccineum]